MRIRSVKPEFWKDERLLALPRDARLLYIALWNEADDAGRLRGRRDYLRGQLFPCDPGPWFDRSLDLLIEAGRVVPYDVDGLHFAYIPTLRVHQRVNRPTESRLPAPPDVVSHHGALTEPSVSPHVSFPSSRGSTDPRALVGLEPVVGTQGSGTQGSGTPPPVAPGEPTVPGAPPPTTVTVHRPDGTLEQLEGRPDPRIGAAVVLVKSAWGSAKEQASGRTAHPPEGVVYRVAEWVVRSNVSEADLRRYIAAHLGKGKGLALLPSCADEYDLTPKPASAARGRGDVDSAWAGAVSGRMDMGKVGR